MKHDLNIELIQEYMTANGLTVTAFCKHCRISNGTYYKLMSGATNLRLNALLKIARAMNLSLKDMFTPINEKELPQHKNDRT